MLSKRLYGIYTTGIATQVISDAQQATVNAQAALDDLEGVANTAVETHDTNEESHADIREQLSAIVSTLTEEGDPWVVE